MKYSWITMLLLGCILLSGCATPLSETVGNEMAASLKACNNRLTRSELISQAGSPAVREPRDDGGEVWVYEYATQKSYTTKDNIAYYEGKAYNFGGGGTETHNYQLRVSIGFDLRGVMDDWRYNGNIAAFPDNPFRKLSTSVPPPLTFDEINSKLETILDNVMNSGDVYKEDFLRQVGKPTSIMPSNEFEGDTWRYLYEMGNKGTPSYKSFHVDLKFNKLDELAGYHYFGKIVRFPNIPFYDLKSPPGFNGIWVLVGDSVHNTRLFFDSFPESVIIHIEWAGDSNDLTGTAEGKGAVKVLDENGNELGCYIAVFDVGRPVERPDVIVNPDYQTRIPGLSLGGVPWP